MDLQEMLAVQPQDYLKEGFLTEEETLRDGLNGLYSLAMAYRLREEGIKPDTIQSLLEEIILIAGLRSPRDSIVEIQRSPELSSSSALRSLILAAAPWLKEPPQWDAFLDHLRRIMAQLALISIGEQLQE